jgi:hypothetical protein
MSGVRALAGAGGKVVVLFRGGAVGRPADGMTGSVTWVTGYIAFAGRMRIRYATCPMAESAAGRQPGVRAHHGVLGRHYPLATTAFESVT